MGVKKGLILTGLGAIALEWAAKETGLPGAGDLLVDFVNAWSEPDCIGSVMHTLVNEYLGKYSEDFFYNKFAALGTASLFSIYGGGLNTLWNTVKICYKKLKQESA